jgi:2-polyprenyl-3-methyl-5-hydroxy-6-metoxy-1,4-benzoquinol methylase
MNDIEREEAKAFNSIIQERIKNGFIPDIQNTQYNEWFINNIWRDPYLVRAWIQPVVNTAIEVFIEKKVKNILEIGCGSGFLSLELARNKFNVMGIDISSESIEIAKRFADNGLLESGNLRYEVDEFLQRKFRKAEFDAIITMGAFHHFEDTEKFTDKVHSILPAGATFICAEPAYDLFDWREAKYVLLIRSFLSDLGMYFEKYEQGHKYFTKYLEKIYKEYKQLSSDETKSQSPNDFSSGYHEMIGSLKNKFRQLRLLKRGLLWVYILGGLRGEKDKLHQLSDVLIEFEQSLVDLNLINPYGFIFVGDKI